MDRYQIGMMVILVIMAVVWLVQRARLNRSLRELARLRREHDADGGVA